MKDLDMMHYLLGMKVWKNIPRTREVCSRDPKEVQDDGLQGKSHAHGIKIEATLQCFIRVSWCHSILSDDWIIDVHDEHETRNMFCCEHFELVPDGSEISSPGCYKAYIEVPEGYN